MSSKRAGRRSVRQPLIEMTWLGNDESYLHFKANELQIQGLTPAQLETMQLRGTVITEDEDPDDEDPNDEFGVYGHMLSRAGNVAILDVSGSLVPKYSWLNQYYGRVSYEEIRGASLAARKAGVDAILVNFDTGGGAATGIMELSDFWKELDKQVSIYSYTGTNMLSGGYWLGSVGRRLYANQMAMVGSIGVITAHFSYARALKENGVDVTMIRAGEFKALGSPYEKLDDVAKAEIQARLDRTYEMFTGHVSAQRDIPVGKLIETAAEGRVFFATDAIEVGLVDAVLSFDAVVQDVSERSRKAKSTSVAKPTAQSMNFKGDDMKRSLNAKGKDAVASGLSVEEALKNPELSQEGEPVEEQAPATPTTEEQAPATPTAEAPAAVAAEPGMLDRVISLSAELATAKAELAAAKSAVEVANGNQTSLMRIAVDAVNRMAVALNQPTIKVDDVTPQALISLHARTQSQFGEKFRIGPQAEVASDDDLSERTPVQVPHLPASLVAI